MKTTLTAKKRTSSERTERLVLHLTPGEKAELRVAAAKLGVSVQEFVLRMAMPAAQHALNEPERTLLTQEEWDTFMAEVDNPPEASPELKVLFAKVLNVPHGAKG